MKKKLSNDVITFHTIGYIFMIIISLVCVIPFIMLVSGSFTSEGYILSHGYSILPKEPSLAAYKTILKNYQDVLSAYSVTIFITVVGTLASLFFTAMAAYVLQRRDFEWRNKFSYFIYFTTLFSGGLTPWYIMMVNMGMKNNLLALILPHLFSVFNILIMRNFMRGIPYEITESAKVDGANDFYIFIKLIFPLSKPVLATVGLFVGLSYWNEWYNTMLFINDSDKLSLQYYLYNMLNNAEAMKEMMAGAGNVSTIGTDVPSESMKLAMTVIATGPILLLYPFVQKYFVKGIIIGSVKG